MTGREQSPETHNCTGPGCPGCYAIYNGGYRRDGGHINENQRQYDEYLRREQGAWERAER